MLILAIESSCDDTSAALLEKKQGKINILSEKTASQIEIHKKYGGVIPEVAGREHAKNIMPLIEEVMQGQPKPDAIAVTTNPGLITGLIVGIGAAQSLAYLWNVPVISVNHIEGHLHSPFLESDLDFESQELPILALTVSGGHTEIILIKKWGEYEKIGGTVDDAAGETFDKVAKMIDLEYPGGPKISKLAEEGNRTAIAFPRPMIKKDNYKMSFSGLKTAALYWIRDHKEANSGENIEDFVLRDFCASIEEAIVDTLIHKTIRAAKRYKPKSIFLVGGVSANKRLREKLQNETNKLNIPCILANPKYSMDNAAMIGAAAYRKAKKKAFTPWQKLSPNPKSDLF